MKQVPRQSTGVLNPYEGPLDIDPQKFKRPAMDELMGAAFRTENDVYAMWRMLNRPDFEPDPEFDITVEGPKSEFWETYRDNLSVATSQKELESIESRIVSEQRDRKIFENSGTAASLSAAMFAGLISPTSLIPLLGPSKGVRGVAEAFALATAASTAQEAVLFGSQETRTGQEAIFNIATGTILGGLMGSAAVGLRRADYETIETSMQGDMAGVPRTMTILKTDATGDSVAEPVLFYDFDEAFDIIAPKVEVPVSGARGELRTSTVPYTLPKKFPVDVSDALKSARLHTAAREANPTVFRQYDDLLVRQESYRKWVQDLEEQGQLSVDNILTRMAQEIEELENARKTVKGKGPKAQLRKQIADKRTDINELLAAREGANAADIAEVRKSLQKVDEALRDLAPAIGAAYKKARGAAEESEVEFNETIESYTGGFVADGPVALAQAREKATIFGRDPILNNEAFAPKGQTEISSPPTLREGAGSVGAAQTRTDVRGIYAPDKVTKKIIEGLGNLSVNIRQMNNPVFPAARYWSAQLGDSGVQVDTGEAFRPAALGGTVSHNAEVHTRAVGEFVQSLDDAYSRHVLGNKVSEEQHQSAVMAQLRSGTRTLPEGKMNFDEFNRVVFEVMNTGADHPDAYVNQARDAARKFFDYYRKQHDAAFSEVQLRYGDENAQKLIPDEFNLGEGVMEYIHHLWDTDTVVERSGELIEDLQAKQMYVLENAHAKDLSRLQKRKARLETAVRIQEMDEAEADALDQTLTADIDALLADPEVKYNREYMTNLRAELKRQNLSDAEVKGQLAAARKDFSSAYTDKNARLRELRVTRNFLRKVREDVEPGSQPAGIEIRDEISQLERQLEEMIDDPNRVVTQERIDAELAIEDRIFELEGKLLDVADLRARLKRMDEAFEEKWSGQRGAGGDVFSEAGVNFRDRARENAEELVHRLSGDRTRIAGLDILGGKRGPELARGLNLPFYQKVKYLETDLETIARAYARHMGSDLEMWRSTGSVNGARIFDEIDNEYKAARDKINADPELDDVKRGKELQKLKAQHETTKDDFVAMIERIRHQRGRPNNPDGVAYRMGRVAKSVNVFRFMGSVVLSSVPDVARPVMMFGLRNTMKNGWGTLISNTAKLKASREELRRFGIAWDPVLHNRAQQIFDVAENYAGRQTGFERGVEFLANKTGFVAGFDRWTAEMKYIAGNVAIATTADALQKVVTGVGGMKQSMAERILADAGIDGILANRIWSQFELTNGSDDFGNGFRLPNTESWEDMGAVQAYAQMINKYVNDAIVTPGIDRPKWMDENIGFQLLAQFRSFAFTATNRTVIRGLQQRDMAVANGVLLSLAMGAISYYTWAMTVGGNAKKQMLEGDFEVWATQAINRSGLLGVLGEVVRVGENVPALQNVPMFSGGGVRTRRPTSLMGAIAGPSFDLAERMATTVQGLDNPTASTLHTVRTMMAYQNVFYIRRLFDAIEEAVVDATGVPERRN